MKLLATDHIDLLLIHRPNSFIDADDVADAFKKLHHSGKVHRFSVSNFTPVQFSLLQSRLPFILATNRTEISPVHQPLLLDGTLDRLQQLHICPMARPCLSGGRLFNSGAFQPLRNELAVVTEELNAQSAEQVIYAWILRLPSQLLPAIGSRKIEHVHAAIESESLSVSRQQWFRTRKAALGYDIPQSYLWRISVQVYATGLHLTIRHLLDGGLTKRLSLATTTLLAHADAQATNEGEVTVNLVTSQNVGQVIGAVTIAETAKGLEFTPDLKVLPPGEHGPHMHMNGSCQPTIKEGKASAAESTGGHYDPHQTGKHEDPEGAGCMDDLSLSVVNNNGNATTPVIASRLRTIDEAEGKALMIHVGDDNMSDQSKPLDDGGTRHACGIIKQSTIESTRRQRLFEL